MTGSSVHTVILKLILVRRPVLFDLMMVLVFAMMVFVLSVFQMVLESVLSGRMGRTPLVLLIGLIVCGIGIRGVQTDISVLRIILGHR
jgi:hypothetical protein